MAVEKLALIEDTPEEVDEYISLLENQEMLPDGSVEVSLGDEAEEPEVPNDFFANLANFLPEDVLDEISSQVLSSAAADKESRATWEDTLKKGLKLTGVELTEGTSPFKGAATCTHPLIIESAVKYQSKTIQEIFQPGGLVRTLIIGRRDDEKEKQALRIKDFLNYQLTESIDDYYTLTERTLLNTALYGTTFRKIIPNPLTKEPDVENISIDNFIVSDDSVSLAKADCYTHIFYLSKSDMRKRQISGFYLDTELEEPTLQNRDGVDDDATKQKGFDNASLTDTSYELYEQHRGLSLDKKYEKYFIDDDVELPYVVTVDKNSGKVISIYRNWKESDPTFKKIVWFVDRHFVPGPGFYSYGLIHLFGNSAMALTFALRALLDSGQFANLQAGFKAKGLRITGGNEPFSPGEWKEVEAVSGDIAKSLHPLPYKEPSSTLFSLLQWLDGRIQKFADSTENVIADSTNLGPVGTTLALLEASAKFEASLHKRNHQAQKKEYKLIAFIDGEYLIDARYPYDVEGQERFILKSDFDSRIDIMPISDPNMPGGTHRLALAAQQIDLAMKQPQIHDMRDVYKRFYMAAGVQEIDKLLPLPPQAQPLDPISDLAKAVQGLPIKAFPGQDHVAHIAVETGWLNDPNNGSSPIMQGPAKAIQAHIREHMMQLIQDKMAMAQQGQPADPQQMAALQAEIAKQIFTSGQASENNLELVNLALQKEDLKLRTRTQIADEMVDAAKLILEKRKQELQRMELALKGSADAKKFEGEQGNEHLDRMLKLLQELIQQEGETGRARIRSEKKVDKSDSKE